MNSKTKKYLIIGGVVIAGVAVWYFFLRKKGGSAGSKAGKLQPPKNALKKSVQKAALARKGKPVQTTGAPIEEQ